MAWIELHQSLFTHRKTVEAALALDLPEVYVVGHLAALWTWALDNAPDGILRAAEPVIERICQWQGERGMLVAALTQAGFLKPDPESGGYLIHDWEAYAGRLMDQRKRNAARMRATRSEQVQRTCGARAPHVHLLPYRTQPYQTRPYRTRRGSKLPGSVRSTKRIERSGTRIPPHLPGPPLSGTKRCPG